VKRLREDQPVTQDMASTMQCALQDEAADRIEELEANALTNRVAIMRLEAKLAKAVEALETTSDIEPDPDNMGRFHDIAITALAELKGEKR